MSSAGRLISMILSVGADEAVEEMDVVIILVEVDITVVVAVFVVAGEELEEEATRRTSRTDSRGT